MSFVPGDWNAICAECGRKRKASDLVRHWQGYYVCPGHSEPRHPQDFVRGVSDVQTVQLSQPQIDDFVAVCDLEGISCICDLAVADCSICEYIPVGLVLG